MLERRSALADAHSKGGQSGSGEKRGLRLGEVRGWTLVQAAAFGASLAEFETAVGASLGVPAMPARIGDVAEAGSRHILRTGPEQFWILAPASDPLAVRLEQAVPPAMGAITPVISAATMSALRAPQSNPATTAVSIPRASIRAIVSSASAACSPLRTVSPERKRVVPKPRR